MSLIKCQQCVGPLAICCCTCGQKANFICQLCIEQHVGRPGTHLFFGIKAAMQVAGTTDKCDVCHQMPASELCSCTYPLPALCIACKVGHVAQSYKKKQHLFLPLKMREKVTSEEALAIVKRDFMRMNLAEDYLRVTIDQISTCESALNQRCDMLCSLLEAHCAEQRSPLSHLKKAIRTALELASSKVSQNVMDISEAPKEELTGLIVDFLTTKNEEALSLFRCVETRGELDVAPAFGMDWECRVREDGSVAETFERVCTKPESSPSPPNPLDFDDVDTYLKAISTENSDRVLHTNQQLTFYRSHVCFLRAKEEALTKTKTLMRTEETLEGWVRCGIALVEEKIALSFPQRRRNDFERCMKTVYETVKRSKEEHDRHIQLQQTQKMDIVKEEDKREDKEITIQVKPKRGRPRNTDRAEGKLQKKPKLSMKESVAKKPHSRGPPSDLIALLEGNLESDSSKDDLSHSD